MSFLGLMLVAWSWYTALSANYFYPKVAVISPFAIFAGVAIVIEGPEFPIQKMSLLNWVCFIAGILAALVNGYLIGAFDQFFSIIP